MPVTSGFYNSVNGDRTYDAEQFGSLFDGIISDGIFPNVGNKFYTRPTGSGMSVYVGSGKAWINRRWVENSGDEQLTIEGANATLDRYDIVCIVVDNNKAVRSAKFQVVKGTPAQSPLPPSLPSGNGIKSMAIAQIKVVKNSRSIAAEDVVNLAGTGNSQYIGGPATTIDLTALQAQLRGEFDTWFKDVRDALANAGGNAVTDVANLKANDKTQDQKIANLESDSTKLESQITTINQKFSTSSTLYGFTDRSNAGLHNSLYRGASLGSSVTPFMEAIRQGTFSGMYVGDYFTYAGKNWRILGFDYFYNVGKTAMTQHHIVVAPDVPLYTNAYHSAASLPGGYGSFAINASGLNTANTTANALFGSANILGAPSRVGTGYASDGKMSSVDWWYSRSFLLTEDMVYGRPVVSPSGYVRDDLSLGQLPAFQLNPGHITSRQDTWLRDIVSSSTAAYIKADGSVGHAPFTYGFGVRPYVVVG